MKKFLLVVSSILLFFVILALIALFTYRKLLSPVGTSDTIIEIEVKEGSTYSTMADILYEKKLIRSKLAYRVYLKLNPPKEVLKTGIYSLTQKMGVEQIVGSLARDGKYINDQEIRITFKEGINMRQFASVIAANTNNTEEAVFEYLNDESFMEEFVKKYWFLSEDILNGNIYYPLEGYLYPNTYNFANRNVSVEDIFTKLLDETEKQLEPYREELENSKYSIHQIMTLASVIELEAPKSEYRKLVSSVFQNRLAKKMQLGSDVTTYYGAQVELSERDLYQAEIEAENGYNTRPASMAGKLPVGPVCNPSIESIEAVLHPETSDYYYFLSDKNGKMYFRKTYQEHLQIKQELIDQGLWYDYQN